MIRYGFLATTRPIIIIASQCTVCYICYTRYTNINISLVPALYRNQYFYWSTSNKNGLLYLLNAVHLMVTIFVKRCTFNGSCPCLVATMHAHNNYYIVGNFWAKSLDECLNINFCDFIFEVTRFWSSYTLKHNIIVTNRDIYIYIYIYIYTIIKKLKI